MTSPFRRPGTEQARTNRALWYRLGVAALLFLLLVGVQGTGATVGPAPAASPVVPSPVVPSPAAATQSGAASATAAPAAPRTRVPVFAYFYQWFTPSSWRRAKQDYPSAGRYSSDDVRVLRNQVKQAKSAGLTGFITSWKDTPPLSSRLRSLVSVARSEDFDIAVVYQALDFERNPLPTATVRKDMTALVASFPGIASTTFGKPVIIWTGTDKFSLADVQQVSAAVRPRALLLATSKSVAGYQRIAPYVDGEAYYWSSADPAVPSVPDKLIAMAGAVHAHHGVWIAPAAPGYDGRALGGRRVVDRDGGATFRRSLQNAQAALPDAIGVISWNEWSENTYVEPSERYGDLYLRIVRSELLGTAAPESARVAGGDSSDDIQTGGWNGWTAMWVLVSVIALGVGGVVFRSVRYGRRLRSPG